MYLIRILSVLLVCDCCKEIPAITQVNAYYTLLLTDIDQLIGGQLMQLEKQRGTEVKVNEPTGN